MIFGVAETAWSHLTRRIRGERTHCRVRSAGTGQLPPILVYPAAAQQPGWWTNGPPTPGSSKLTNLLGDTRAAVLSVIEDGCTTTELPRRVGVSLPSVSRHATTLREAGLVTSVRQRNTIIHTLTPLGQALIRATTSKSPAARHPYPEARSARSPAMPPATPAATADTAASTNTAG
ncbi:MAG TPA: winged helix-turn-helix domain-containing protein [Micromonosporaceae bacterium]